MLWELQRRSVKKIILIDFYSPFVFVQFSFLFPHFFWFWKWMWCKTYVMSQKSWERGMFTTTLHHLFAFLQHSVSIWEQFLQFRKQNAFLLLLQKGFPLYTISHFITHQMFSVSDRSELQRGQFSKEVLLFFWSRFSHPKLESSTEKCSDLKNVNIKYPDSL